MAGLLPGHRNHPDVSLDQHFANRVAELARVVLARRRVYLDTRYWIFLRDAELGRAHKPVHVELLQLLRSAVHSGRFICPIGDSTFVELLKQSDPTTRLATARLIDALSLGVTIQNAHDRLKTELVHFLASVTGRQGVPGPPIERVWLRVGHVLGTAEPVYEDVSADEQLAISKTFFDVMWAVTLEEMLLDTPRPHDVSDTDFQATATRITAACKADGSHFTNFKALYLAEINGFFDVHEEHLRSAFAEIHRHLLPHERPATSADFRSDSRIIVNAFTNLFRLGQLGTAVPTAQIVAGLYAAIRWQRQRSFVASDFYDFYHATAALPYCDVFLTESFLGTLLTCPPLDLARIFDTTVVWDEADAIEALQALPVLPVLYREDPK